MAKLNWFLTLKNMASTDETAKELLNAINNAETDDAKATAKAEAKEYVESFADNETAEPIAEITETPIEQPESETPTETPVKELEIDVETESDEPTGERPEPIPEADNSLIERIRRRQKIAEENIKKRRNQPITLSEQKAAAIEKGKEVMRRNSEIAERRKALHEMIEKQQAERRASDAKNMVGLLTILLRELKLNIRLEIICKKHNITRKDLEALKATNPYGWAQCLMERPKLEVELEMYIKE